MDLDEVIDEARRVNYELGRVTERQRVIGIINHCLGK